MINIHAISSFFKFYIGANTYYRVHSPFVFKLLQNTIEDKRHYYIFDKIELLRKELQQDSTTVKVNDLGAGSMTSKRKERAIKDIARTAVSPQYQSEVLFKLAQFFETKRSIELGTSLGVSALYLSGYNKNSQLYTLEGSEAILEKAKANFSSFGAKNIFSILGNFDQTLPIALKELQTLDLCYIDGNHAKAPTIKYFEWCLPHIHKDAVLIFDDIYWSKEMTEAWEQIKAHHAVKLTVDLYYFGLVFFNPDVKEIQHFKIIASKFKMWQRYI